MTLSEVIAKILLLVMRNVDCIHLHCILCEDKLVFTNHIKSIELPLSEISDEKYVIKYITDKLEDLDSNKELKIDYKNRLRLVDILGQEVL